MIERIGRRKFNIYAFDIETHNDEESIQKNESSMWLGCFIDETSKIDEESSYFYTMESFITHLEKITNKRRKSAKESRPCNNVAIYIYNLSFEWSFILPVLLEKFNFHYEEKITDESEYSYNSVSTKSVSSVWLIQMKFAKNSGLIIFKDLAKIYGGGLGKVAKAFNLPTQKGEIDYRLNRLHNYTPTKDEKEYCFKDTRIIIDILLIMQQKKDKFFFGVSSMASYSMKFLLETAYPNEYRPYKAFRRDYPELSKEETEFLRHSVSGGITYAPELWQFKDVNEKILHIDAHQMHPSSAYLHNYPYGTGIYHKGKPKIEVKKTFCCHIKVSYTGVKIHSIITLIGIPFIDDFELWLWDFEIDTMYKCYNDLKIKYIDYYEYDTKPLKWRKYYSNNYNKRLEAKKNKDEFYTLYYKLLNNSSYGKLLEKPHNQIFKNTINEDGIIDSIIEDKDIFSQEISAKYTYLPVGSSIPAWSRVCLIETALLFDYRKILYFDTDSIFIIYDKESAKVWEEEIDKTDFLGGWGLEEIADKGQFTAPKRYKLEVNGLATIKAGGINFNSYQEEQAEKLGIKKDEYIISYDEINIISSKWKVQRAFRCKGGTLIDFQEKEMNIQQKYIDIYNKNIV